MYALDRHKRVARMVGYALTADDPGIWNDTAFVLSRRLTQLELASMAYAALSALDPDARLPVFKSAGGELTTHSPVPPLLGLMDEASFWADLASRNELKAYALACYKRMPPKDQAAFWAHVGKAA